MQRSCCSVLFAALCGMVILGCIAWVGYDGAKGEPIFWQEAIALTFSHCLGS